MEFGDVCRIAGDQVINTIYNIAAFDEVVNEIAAYKPRATSD